MPVYTYACKNCGIQEIHQSIYDNALTSCPSCSTIDFKKTFGNVAVQFKGSGFYKTDSRSTKGD